MTPLRAKGKRGWFGDSAGHAEAGRKGGQARGRKASQAPEIGESELEEV